MVEKVYENFTNEYDGKLTRMRKNDNMLTAQHSAAQQVSYH